LLVKLHHASEMERYRADDGSVPDVVACAVEKERGEKVRLGEKRGREEGDDVPYSVEHLRKREGRERVSFGRFDSFRREREKKGREGRTPGHLDSG